MQFESMNECVKSRLVQLEKPLSSRYLSGECRNRKVTDYESKHWVIIIRM
jgi:hypothetical protein